MVNFYIKRICAAGAGVPDAIVELTEGLNIIHGISDTGKTCILMCIDYIFGGSDLPFDKDVTGYSEVRITLKTPSYEILLVRLLGKNIITVTCEEDDSFNGKYDSKYRADSNNSVISALFLRLIGIEDEITLIKNKGFTRFRLTWTNFVHMFLLKEDEIDRRESILLPKREEGNTLFFSTLIYLLTGEDFSNYDAQEEKRIRDAKKNEIVAHIKGEIRNMADRKEVLENLLLEQGDIELGNKIQGIITEVSAVKKRIYEANECGKDLLHQIMMAREELVNCDLMLDRHSSLRKHYIADIKRLTLIVDGETVMDDMPVLEKCPYCEGEITVDEQESYTETARFELARIVEQLNGLAQVEAGVSERKNEIVGRIQSLNIQKTDIDGLINERLKPMEVELGTMLKSYQKVMKIRGELDFIQRFTNDMAAQLREKEAVGETKLEYLPKEHFDTKFREAIDNYLKDIFTKCNFEKFLTAHLDVDGKFDVLVNGANKATTRGQGYRAYINTVLALAIRKYLKDHGEYCPGVFFVHSPLQTLKQGVNDHAPDSMKSALFKYLLESQDYGQVVVIENEIPELKYESFGVTPIFFTGGKSPGRYGFLHLEGQY